MNNRKTIETTEEDTSKGTLKYKDYHTVTLKMKTTRPILGGRPATPETCARLGLSQLNAFARDTSGRIYFPASWLRAMLRDTSNVVNQSQIVAQNWIKYKDMTILSKVKPTVLQMKTQPITAGRKQGREVNFETLEEGVEFETSMLVPEIVVPIIKKWVEHGGEWEGVGAYRKGYGRFKVVSFTDGGRI